MTRGGVTRRYASALFASALKLGCEDKVAGDLQLVERTLRENAALRVVVTQSFATDTQRKSVIRRVFGPHVHQVTLSFLELLIDKRREDVLEGAEAAYRRIADEKMGVERSEVISAVQLTESEITEATAALAKLTGKKVVLEQKVDPAILGGLVFRVGDSLIDGSVRGQLGQIYKALAGAR